MVAKKRELLPNGEHFSPFVGPLVYQLSDKHSLIDNLDFDRRDGYRISKLMQELEENKLKQNLGEDEKRHIEARIQRFKHPAEGLCLLRTSSESHWVSAFVEHIFRRCWKHPADQDGWDDGFSSFFEIPSTRSEVKEACGYDLSIGPFRSADRIRTMHKTVLEWCDRSWTWSAQPKDLKHARDLHESKHEVFLVLHVFHCIHDWRRMGEKVSGDDPQRQLTLPRFTTLLRTVIIDLRNIPGIAGATTWTVRYRPPEPTGDTDQARLDSLVGYAHYEITVDNRPVDKDKVEAAVANLEKFRGVVEKSWSGPWKEFTP